MASSLLISFEYIQLGLRLRKCLSPPMYIIPSRWRLIILQQGVWEVAPVSELSVEAVLIKLHTAGKGPPTDTALLTLHLRTKRKNTQPELLLWTIHSVWRFTTFNYFHNNNPTPSQRLCQRYGVLTQYFTALLIHLSHLIIILLFIFPTVDNKIFSWGNGTSGQ